MKNYMEFVLSVIVLAIAIGLDVFIVMFGRLTEVSLISVVCTVCLLAGPVLAGMYLTGKTGERLMEKDEEL